ncbi:hypothetical protein LOK49_Contig80G00005 [Camellia lanceoleosa]|nr:hypothetical protein LOK49_Contig80G00005 [Camellia lanceoleosa]
MNNKIVMESPKRESNERECRVNSEILREREFILLEVGLQRRE